MADPLETDLIDLSISVTGLELTDDLVFTSGADAIAQLCEEGLGTIRGEWFLDENEGFPYLENASVTAAEAVLGQRYDEIKARDAASGILRATPGVSTISELVLTLSAQRELTIRFVVSTIYGEASGEVTV